MARHTPGPWEVVRRRGNYAEGTYPEVQGFRVSGTLYNYHRETVEANARLIAAAPQLYDAIINVMTDAQLDTKPAALGGLTIRQLLATIERD